MYMMFAFELNINSADTQEMAGLRPSIIGVTKEFYTS
jgi:hypothetical protein